MTEQNSSGNVLIVLHVEDDPGHALLTRKALEDLPFACDVRHIKDGMSAVNYLNRRGDFVDPASSPRPALVLLDLNLPKIKGLDVLKNIKGNSALRDIPVAILTTSYSTEDMRLAYEHQADDYLTKPGDYAETVKLLHKVVATLTQAVNTTD